MKTVLYPEDERGKGEYGWLSTRYSFSFSNWYEPTKMGFGALRVLNDDVIAAGQGFPTHSHKDMEIITIVTKGSIRHTDSMGNEYVLKEGDVQVMSAGTGVMHSEYNSEASESLSLFQLWIQPNIRNIEPQYSQKSFNYKEVRNSIVELIGKETLRINQDAYISYGVLDTEASLEYHVHNSSYGVYIFVEDGSLKIGNDIVEKRDAIGVSDIDSVEITGNSHATFLVIEVPIEV